MSRMAIAVLISVIVATPSVAATEGVADSEGTIHIGFKLGPSNVQNKPSGFGMYGGYTIVGPNSFAQNSFLSKLSLAAEGEYVDLGSSSVGTRLAHKAAALGVAGVATYPIDAEFAVIAKAGLTTLNHTVQCTPLACRSVTTTGVHGAIAGLYKFTPMMSIHADYDFYPEGYSMMSAGVVYKF